MYIAQQLKQKSIVEYVLYMWQVEDIIRAYSFDLDKISTQYIPQFQLDPEREKELTQWYADLIEMMRSEHVMQQGHLQINRNTVAWLDDLHARLMASSKYPFYNAAYFKALPYIVELRAKGESKEVSEVENCLDLLYGVMMLKMQKKPLSADTQKAVDDVVKFMGMLADNYAKDKAEQLEF